MSEMIERVAKAIAETKARDWSRMSETGRGWWREHARAAIEAMREPTTNMLMASGVHGTTNQSKYRAMIDEALR